MPSLFIRFLKHRGGNFAMYFAVCLPVLAALVAFVYESNSLSNQKAYIQVVADNTALALASEISVTAQNAVDLTELATERVAATMQSRPNLAAQPRTVLASLMQDEDSDVPNGIKIEIIQTPVLYFPELLGWPDVEDMQVDAVVARFGQRNICVIALNEDDKDTIFMQDNSEMTAPNCHIISNSSSSNGVGALHHTRMQATAILSAGGYYGDDTNFNPLPNEDQPIIPDPLERVPEPRHNRDCDYNGIFSAMTLTDNGNEYVLSPGTYCGDIILNGNRTYRFEPGVYTLDSRNAMFSVIDQASLIAHDVTIFLKGQNTRIFFGKDSTIEMSAMRRGGAAGILIFEDRHHTPTTHTFQSDNMRYMVGTIYMPRSELVIDTEHAVSDRSEYTAIVANRLTLRARSNLWLNTNYDATDVPVPPGIGEQGNTDSKLVY